MSDDKSKTGADRLRVSKNEDYEVEYLVKKWGVSKEDVIRAIDKSGPMRTDIEAELERQKGQK